MADLKEKKTLWEKYAFVTHLVAITLIIFSLKLAFDIRTYALQDYGYVIHEFDPWFNYRATEYLDEHGVEKFFKWFDHRSWFPLGRPVGTTIYPGMQLTAVFLKHIFHNYGSIIPHLNLQNYTLNEICCLIPCWFGVTSSIFTGLIGFETSRSLVVASLTTFIMAIIPAHIMRSVGGGYDNESVAVTAMTMTFYFWIKSISKNSSFFNNIFFGILSGFAYIYMVAAWGGFIFVLNMISFHAFYLCLRSEQFSIFTKSSTFSYKLGISFSLFYIIGTIGAIQIPVVGWSPLKSLEQLFGLVTLFATLSVMFCQFVRMNIITTKIRNKRKEQKKKVFSSEEEEINEEYKKFLFQFGAVITGIGCIFIGMLYPTGYFGPLSARIRGLFVPHTRTGNPLVDSVAEHRSTSPTAYIRYLYYCLLLTPIGFAINMSSKKYNKRADQNMFLTLYAFWSYYFSSKMVRLMILLGPIASILSAIAIEAMIQWSYTQLFEQDDTEDIVKEKDVKGSVSSNKSKRNKKKVKDSTPNEDILVTEMRRTYNQSKTSRKVVAGLTIVAMFYFTPKFVSFCHQMAHRSSHPSIMFKVKNRAGQDMIIDDYREAYWWLRDNTDEDTRVMAWWDYGYQISGIGKRITIADGNTWNHEHIATLGKCLVSEEKIGHEMITHLADYVLLWAGGGGDDLGKSPHIARIANSVYSELCGVDDPLCRKFTFEDRARKHPLEMMEKSVIYRLYSGVHDPDLFTLAYESKHKKVKIYKVNHVNMESRSYSFNESNYICDESGWLCRGQYPPKFRKFMSTKQDFAQLEDFNVDKGKESGEYQKQYHKAFGKGN